MSNAQSVADKLSVVFAKVSRRLNDLNISIFGTKCDVLRIAVGTPDSWGQTVDDLKDCILTSVYIKHPFNSRIQLFAEADKATGNVDTEAIDLWDFLPITLKVPFSGDDQEQPINLMRGDLVIQVMSDEYGTKIPIILQIQRMYGEFSVATLCGKEYECSLFRGSPQDNIKAAIDLYVQSLAG